ncbi:chromate efflux transporter [Pseudooceanicola nanhaiensis]|uniref:chromate efflux transporter n=1 Tax=Pseudooceanicola nanhaiensis TaxID=375761 RepID=UPI001CD48349|nr:chromate efflux transporter [Pseudooceanicola nanhaiensis]MCA0919866.1 chromate efflux transporter [Pseudooceanicola nanhaiensis]
MTVSPPPSPSDLFKVFGRIGLLSFGGPAAQIALMHRELVEERPWLEDSKFLGALSFCMLLPGPEAMQLATYAGWRLRGTVGGLIAGGLFVLPGALVIAALALAYGQWGTLPLVQAAFLGIKALVIVIVLQALSRLARKTLTAPDRWLLAGLAFVATFAFSLPFPLIVALAALWGALAARPPASAPPPAAQGALRESLRQTLLWGALWLGPVAALALSGAEFLTAIALFFSKLSVVTFGGAYAVLAYMAQAAVETHGWLSAQQMIDALGLAETTPGPLILVTQFVAMVAGQNASGPGLALAAGLMALWVTFIPCFLWIFALAPHVERVLAQPRLQGALQGITAAVAGVILNLSVFFALHVFFAEVETGGLWLRPLWDSLQPEAVVLTILAAWLVFGLKRGPLVALGPMALAGIALGAIAS